MLLTMLNWSAMRLSHRPRTHPTPLLYRQRSFWYARRIDTSAGSKFFDAARHVTHMLISFHKPLGVRLRSVKRTRMRVGHGTCRVFLCLSFASMIGFHGRERGTCVESGGEHGPGRKMGASAWKRWQRWKDMDRCGDRRKDGTGRMGGRRRCFYTPVFTV